MTALDPTALDAAIRARCTTADVHLMCSWPDCRCKTPKAPMEAAITAYLSTRREQGWEERLVSVEDTRASRYRRLLGDPRQRVTVPTEREPKP